MAASMVAEKAVCLVAKRAAWRAEWSVEPMVVRWVTSWVAPTDVHSAA